jgi:hypothetical protein
LGLKAIIVLLQTKAFVLPSSVLYSVREEERKPALPLDSPRLVYKTLKFKIQTHSSKKKESRYDA